MTSTLSLSVATSIVLVEDDPAYAEIVGEGLKDAWPGPLEVTSYERPSDAREGLTDHQPDRALLDLSPPDAHRVGVLGEVVAVAPRTPVIVLTGREERDGLG